MKRLFLFFLLIGYWSVVRASDTVFIKEAQVPILIERQDNLLFYLRFDARDSRMLDGVTVDLSRCKNLDDIQSVKLYYGGTEARQEEDKNRFAPVSYISSFSPGKTLSAYPSYSIKCAEELNVSESVALKCNYKLFPGVNFFWVSLQVKPGTSLLSKVTADLSSVTIDGKEAVCKKVSPDGIVHRMGVGVRHAGNDGASAFRIPGLVTTNKDRRLAGCPKWGRRPFYLGRYKDKYSVDCRGVDTRYGESTGMVEFTAGNGKELYGSTRDDEEYR